MIQGEIWQPDDWKTGFFIFFLIFLFSSASYDLEKKRIQQDINTRDAQSLHTADSQKRLCVCVCVCVWAVHIAW